MSSKSKQQGKKLSVPREMSEIQQDYQHVCYQAGAIQYQIRIETQKLESLNHRLQAINKEAAARNALDQEKSKDAPAEAAKAVSNA